MAPHTTDKMPWAPPRRYDLQARSTRGGAVTALFETFVFTTALGCIDAGTPAGAGCFVDTVGCPTAAPCATIPTMGS